MVNWMCLVSVSVTVYYQCHCQADTAEADNELQWWWRWWWWWWLLTQNDCMSLWQILPDGDLRPQAKHLQSRAEYLLKVVRRQTLGDTKTPVSVCSHMYISWQLLFLMVLVCHLSLHNITGHFTRAVTTRIWEKFANNILTFMNRVS